MRLVLHLQLDVVEKVARAHGGRAQALPAVLADLLDGKIVRCSLVAGQGFAVGLQRHAHVLADR
eukprot:7375967-Prymnesium_polylepis.1